MNSPGLHSALIMHANARIGETSNYHYEYTTDHTGSMSTGTPSSLLFARKPTISITDESSEGTDNPMDIQQPPPHVVDYWFDQLGLSLDSTSSENPSNATGYLFQFPPFDGINHSASGAGNVETTFLVNPLVSNIESQETPVSPPSPANQVKRWQAPPRGVARHQPHIVRGRQRSIRKVHDRPGRRPAAEYEPDPLKLETLCRLRGGMQFACRWIPRAFVGGVTLGALLRRLELTEIESMSFPGGFEPCLAYDGFLQMADDGFECCLCPVGKRVWWKNKKDAVRHFRKFHFGLGDQCITCHKNIYSTGEMNSHRCARPQNLTALTTAMGPGASSDSPVDSGSGFQVL